MNLQEQIYQAVETIAENIINKTSYLYQVQGVIKKVDPLGNYYKFDYQGTEFTGYSVSGEKYYENDLVYVLFTNSDPMAKKMIISKVEAYNNTIDMSDVVDNMPRIELTGQNIFIQAPNGTIAPLNTTITANCYNGILAEKWFIDDVETTMGVSEDKQSISVPSSLMQNKNSIILKAVADDGKLFDTISVIKLIDGEVGQSTLFIDFDKPSISIPTDANGNNGNYTSASVQYTVFEGLEDVTSEWGVPTVATTSGITIAHDTTNNTVKVSLLTADVAQITFKFEKDGATLTKRIEVVKVKWGQDGIIGSDGASAYTISLSDEATLWATSSDGTPLTNASAEVKASVYKGVDRLVLGSGLAGTETYKIKSVTPSTASGVTVALSSNGSAVTFSVSTANKITKDREEYTIIVLADGIEFEKTFTWALSKSGANGQDGQDGQDAEIVSIMMNASVIVKQYDEGDEGVYSHYPSTVLATPNFSNVAYTKWQRMVGSTWTDITNNAALGLSVDVTTKELSIVSEKAASLMPMRIRVLATNNSGATVTDETTIQYIEDSRQDYTFMFSNPVVQIVGDDFTNASTRIDLFYGTVKQSGWTYTIKDDPRLVALINGDTLYVTDILPYSSGYVEENTDKYLNKNKVEIEIIATKPGRTTQKINISAEKVGGRATIYGSDVAPANPAINDLWWNLGVTPNVLLIFDGQEWIETVEVTERFKEFQEGLEGYRVAVGESIQSIQAGRGNMLMGADSVVKHWTSLNGTLEQGPLGENSRSIKSRYHIATPEDGQVAAETDFFRLSNTSVYTGEFVPKVPYTLSFKVKGSQVSQVAVYLAHNDATRKNLMTVVPTEEWDRRNITFYVDEGQTLFHSLVFEATNSSNVDFVSSIELEEIKLEVGDRVTSWTPATIDYKSEIEITSQNITAVSSKTTENEEKIASLELDYEKLSLKFESQVVGGANLLINSNFEKGTNYEAGKIGWDESVNGTRLPNSWTLFNKNVPSFDQGKHATLVEDGVTWGVKFIESGTGIDANREKCLYQVLGNVQKARLLPGETVTFSMDVYAEIGAPRMMWGLKYGTTEVSTPAFYPAMSEFYPSIVDGWKRYSKTITIRDDIDLNSEITLYIQGHSTEAGTFTVRNLQLQRGDAATDWNQSPIDYEEQLASLEKISTALIVGVDGITASFNNYITDQSSFIRMNASDEGNPTLTLGKLPSEQDKEPAEMIIDNEGLKIKAGNSVLASFNKDGMLVQKGTILTSLEIGGVIFYSEPNGSVSLKAVKK